MWLCLVLCKTSRSVPTRSDKFRVRHDIGTRPWFTCPCYKECTVRCPHGAHMHKRKAKPAAIIARCVRAKSALAPLRIPPSQQNPFRSSTATPTYSLPAGQTASSPPLATVSNCYPRQISTGGVRSTADILPGFATTGSRAQTSTVVRWNAVAAIARSEPGHRH